MKNLRTGPIRIGAERRAVEQDAAAEMGHKCPECGSDKYMPSGGCWVCLTCGYSPCK